MTEAPDYQYLTTTGVIVPDTSQILSDVTEEYTSVFGEDLVTTPDSPAGLLITAEALARSQVVNNNAAVANEINPNIAGGVFLDAILALTGMQRTPQTQTLVPGVSLTGVAGTVIPQGSQAQTAAGDLFETIADVTLGISGTATVDFTSVNYGPIPCASDALTQIVSAILGWETVTNSTAGTLGTTTQSDQAARALRQNTLAFQGVSLAEAITSALYATQGVTSLTFQENVDAGTETINGISMVGHSIYACVAGGTNTDVAAALLENKSSGCAWNGGTTVNVVEPASGQTYAVKFDRPSQIGIIISVTTSNGNAQNITQAILDYAAGNMNGFAGFIVGADVSPFEIAGAITSRYPSYYISQVLISLESPLDLEPTSIPIGVNEQAFTQSEFISITVG